MKNNRGNFLKKVCLAEHSSFARNILSLEVLLHTFFLSFLFLSFSYFILFLFSLSLSLSFLHFVSLLPIMIFIITIYDNTNKRKKFHKKIFKNNFFYAYLLKRTYLLMYPYISKTIMFKSY